MLLRRVSVLFLWIIPLPVLSFAYQPGELRRYASAGAVQAALIGAAAWTIARRSDRFSDTGDERARQATIVASVLLVLSWAVASLALNMNDPPIGQAWLATQADQHFRYGVLAAGYLLDLAGLGVLAARLLGASEGTFSVLGFTAAATSAVLFILLFVPYPHILTARFAYETEFGTAPAWWAVFRAAFGSMEAVQRSLMYVAMSLFAIGLRRGRLIGRTSVTCVGALTLLAAFANVTVHVPPAIPLLLPYSIGVALMWRNGAGAD